MDAKNGRAGGLPPDGRRLPVFRNDYFPTSNFICGAGGYYSPSPALTTTVTKYDLTCTVQNAISMGVTDRLFVQVFAYVGTASTKKVSGELHLEGVLNGNYDSSVMLPSLHAPPSIASVSPTSGVAGTVVTVSGSGFGASQGTSTLAFAGLTAAPTSWNETTITSAVPTGAVSGPVVVTVNGAPSNGINFTVPPPPSLTSLTPAMGGSGTPIVLSGANFLPVQGSSTVTFAGTAATPTAWSDTSITVPVPTGAVTGPVSVTVGGRGSNILSFTVTSTGTLTGTINRASDGSPAAGAMVEVLQAGATTASVTSAANGTYTVGPVDSGIYQVRVSAIGLSTHLATEVAISGSSTLHVSLPGIGSISGRITSIDGLTPLPAGVRAMTGSTVIATSGADANGDYLITGLPPGQYTIQAARGTMAAESSTRTTWDATASNKKSAPTWSIARLRASMRAKCRTPRRF